MKEIERKKRQLEDKAVLGTGKKYFKRGDLAKQEAEEYLKKKQKLDGSGIENITSSLNATDESSQDSACNQAIDEKKIPLSRKEVIRRLRERCEPIRLFDESDYDSFQRLKKLEMLEPESNKGFKNDFRDALDKVDEEMFLHEVLKTSDHGRVTDVTIRNDGTKYEDILTMGEKLGEEESETNCEIILKFLKLVLNLWGDELNQRPEDQKQSMKGRVVSATHMQTVSYMKPLFRKLKRHDVSVDILGCLIDIVKHLLKRDYLKANEAYLEMAIGNAPWPIGVTMVGIHARTGREKIFAKNVAHVLNDETQRKYIQGLKRLMTQAQKYFPTDPSKSVNYEPPAKSNQD